MGLSKIKQYLYLMTKISVVTNDLVKRAQPQEISVSRICESMYMNVLNMEMKPSCKILSKSRSKQLICKIIYKIWNMSLLEVKLNTN